MFRSWHTQMISHHIHTHKHECSQEIYTTIPTYCFCLDKTTQSHTKSRQNNIHLVQPYPAEYTSNLDLKIHNNALPMATHPKVLGLTFDPELTYSTHIYNISVHAHKPRQTIKSLTATGWGKQKETGSIETGSVVCLFHMVTSCILDQHEQSASHAECSIENCHRMHTRHKHTTSA